MRSFLYFNSNVMFVPVLALLAIWLIWKGGVRGRLFVGFMLLTFIIGDPLIVNSLKKFIDRPRPFTALTDIHLLVGRTDNPSMPSGHAANWFAAAVVVIRLLPAQPLVHAADRPFGGVLARLPGRALSERRGGRRDDRLRLRRRGTLGFRTPSGGYWGPGGSRFGTRRSLH